MTLSRTFLPMLAAYAGAHLSSNTPFGPLPPHCVHELPDGARTTRLQQGGFKVTLLDGSYKMLPKCDRSKIGGPLPPNYDGWMAYTELNVTQAGLDAGTSFDAFTSVMSVPDVPKAKADVLYFFPGLQNIDWIPKVDPEPRDAFDIIQPVLQYPGTLPGTWDLRSWYVTLDSGALASRPIVGIKPGDAILCNMTRSGPDSWVISGALQSDPSKITTQDATAARLKLQPWAYSAVCECYGCRGCNTYPTEPIVFSKNKLYQNGQLVSGTNGLWNVTPRKPDKLFCKEVAVVDVTTGDATISFA